MAHLLKEIFQASNHLQCLLLDFVSQAQAWSYANADQKTGPKQPEIPDKIVELVAQFPAPSVQSEMQVESYADHPIILEHEEEKQVLQMPKSKKEIKKQKTEKQAQSTKVLEAQTEKQQAGPKVVEVMSPKVTPVQEFKCQKCPKVFALQKSVRRHEKLHEKQ